MEEFRLQPREYLLVPLTIAVGVLFVYDVPPIGLPLAAAVLGRFVYAGAGTLAVGTAVLAAIAAGVLGWSRILMVAPTLLALVWAASALRRRAAWQVFAVVTAAAFAGFFATSLVSAYQAGVTLPQGVAAETAVIMQGLDDMFGTPAADPGLRLTYESARESIETLLNQIWPGVNLAFMMLSAAISTLFLSRLARVHRIETTGPRPLDRLDVSWHVAWPLIAGLATLAWSSYAEVASRLPAAIGWNLVLVSLAVLTVQGLGVSEASLKRLRLGPLLRFLAYGVMFWFGALVPVLALLGTADLWVNFRKLPRGAGVAEPPEDGDGGPPKRGVE